MLNALIAMMSSTCSLVSYDKVSQWELQRLSVVLLLESMLACRRLLFNKGEPIDVVAFDFRRKEMIKKTRYFTKVTSVLPTDTERGAAIMKRKDMIQDQPFKELHDPGSSRRDSVRSASDAMTSAGHVAHLDLLACFIHQQALLGRFAGAYEDVHSESREESSHQTPHKMENSSSSTSHLHSDDAVGKAKERMSSRPKADLPAIKESKKSESEATREAQGQGQGQSYASMRQTLLQASLAAKGAKRSSAQRRAGVEQTTPTNSPGSNQRQKRKRHNSNRVVRKRTTSRNDQHDRRPKPFHFQPDEGKVVSNPPQGSSGNAAWSRPRLTRTQSELPTPEVFTIEAQAAVQQHGQKT